MPTLIEKDTPIYTKKLQNNLRLTVNIHEDSPLIAFAFSIGAGRFYEGDTVCGLSHLLEHCIFGPNDAFPEVGQLTHFVDKNQGQLNAWTANRSTNFHLAIPPHAAYEALFMLTNKLFDPRFDLADIAREIDTIEAEFNTKTKDENRKLLSVQRSLCHPLHPFSRFEHGNKKSLSTLSLKALREQLLRYHQRLYQASNTAFAVSLPKGLLPDQAAFDSFITHLIELLENIEGDEPPTPLALPMAFTLPSNPQIIHIDSPHEVLTFSYMIDSNSDEETDNLAMTMVESLLSSRHQGGLYYHLKNHVDLNSFTIKDGFEDPHQQELQICIGLRSTASQDLMALIYAYTKQYFGHFNDRACEAWRFREKQRQLELQGEFAEKAPMLQRTIELAESLQMSRIDSDPMTSLKADHPKVQSRLADIFKQLSSQHPRIYSQGKKQALSHVSDFFNTPYQIEEHIGLEQAIAHWPRIKFQRAPQNPYLPNNIQLSSTHSQHAKAIQQDPVNYTWDEAGIKLAFWRYRDKNKPLGDIYISLHTHAMQGSIETAVCKRIWLASAQDGLSSLLAQTKEAGLYFRLYGHQNGVCLHSSGFTEKQILLCYDVLNTIKQHQVNTNDFTRYKSQVRQNLNRGLHLKPINKLFSALSMSVNPQVYSMETLIDALDKLSFDEFAKQQVKFFEAVYLEVLQVGDWNLINAQQLVDHLKAKFSPCTKPSSIVEDKMTSMSREQDIRVMGKQDNAFMLYQSFGQLDKQEQTLQALACSLLIESLLSPYIFNEFRHVRKLGYNVGIGYKPIGLHAGIAIFAQSATLSASAIEDEVMQGLQTIFDALHREDLQLDNIKQHLFEQLNQNIQSASDLGRFLWMHFDNLHPLSYLDTLKLSLTEIDEPSLLSSIEKMLQDNPMRCRFRSFCSLE